MSTYLVKNESNGYLALEKKKHGTAAVWVGIENAKHFESVEGAKKELKEALDSMFVNAKQKAENHMKQGGYPTNPRTHTLRYNVRRELTTCSKEKFLKTVIEAMDNGLEKVKNAGADKAERNLAIRNLEIIVKELNKLEPELSVNKVDFVVSSYSSHTNSNRVDENSLEIYINCLKDKVSKMSTHELEEKGKFQDSKGAMSYKMPEAIMSLTKVRMPVTAIDLLPSWFGIVYKGIDRLVFEAHLNSSELLDKIEMYFVRSSNGWWSEAESGYLKFDEMIHKAQVFYSEETAKSLIKKNKNNPNAQEAIIVKGSYIMERVSAPGGDPSKIKDVQSATLYSACEAKNIEQALNDVLKERKAVIANKKNVEQGVPETGDFEQTEECVEIKKPRRLGL